MTVSIHRHVSRPTFPAWLALVFLAILSRELPALADGALAGEYPRLSRSLFREPYAYDSKTIALFHLDERGEKEMPDLDALLGATGATAGHELPSIIVAPSRTAGRDGTTARQTANATPTGQPADLVGEAALVADGRFGGGLRVDGNHGALLAKGLAGNHEAWTIECWLALQTLPDNTRIVMEGESQPGHNPFRLLLHPNGSLELEWAGQATGWPNLSLTPETWTHIALGVTIAWPHGNAVHFFANGKPVKPLAAEHHDAATCIRTADTVRFGGDWKGQNGMNAILDEIRVSRGLREFYPDETAWTRPDTLAQALSQPHVRDADDLLFHLDGNGTTAPATAAPGTRHKPFALSESDWELTPVKAAATFPEGIQGRALLLGQGGPRPVYGAAGNILPPQGTIAFWMRPLDWDNFTRNNPYDATPPTTFGLFQLDCTTVPGSHEAIFRKVYPVLQFSIVMHLPEAANEPPPLHPGVWTHVAMTWRGADFTYYINGQQKSPDGAFEAKLDLRTADDPYPYKKASPRWWTESTPVLLRFQENMYWEQRGKPMPKTALDEFRIYRRPLAPSEIANLARLYDPRQPLEPLPPVEMAMAYNGVSGQVTATVTPLMPEYRRAVEAVVTVTRAGEPEPVGTNALAFDDSLVGIVDIVTPPLDFATYQVQAEVRDAAGQSLGRAEQSFTRTPPPWWRNELGISRKVMPDWSPLRVEGGIIHVDERTIILGDSGLPERIVTRGADLLAGPVALAASRDGQPLALAATGPLRLEPYGEVRADAAGGLRGGGLDVRIASYTEFDGMIWFTLALTPETEGQSTTLDQLTLRVSLTPDSAELIHWWSGNREFRDPKGVHIGALPDTPGVVFRSNDDETLTRPPELRGSFIPYLLLTGNERGLAWFAENDRGWTQSVDTPAVSVERADGKVTLVLQLVSQPVTVDARREIAFGLHPTPVKRLDPLWRQYPGFSNVIPDTFSANNLKGRKGVTAFSLYPEDDWDAVKRRIDGEGMGKGAPGLKGLYLGQLRNLEKAGIANPPPQTLTVPGLYWDMQWNYIPPELEHTREWAATWALNYQYYTPEFVDFCSWAWNDWIDKTDKFVQGAYIDDCWGAPITREGGPCTYKLPDGHVQPGYQFLGQRERFKRMRQISWDHGVWPHLTAHTTHTFFIPYHSFFDLILDGEDFYSFPPRQSDFIDHWPLDRMRFMHNAKWGLVTTWLSWTGNSTPTDKFPAWTFRQSRAYVANLALHDINWGFAEDVRRDFGFRQVGMAPGTTYVPYWEEHGLYQHDHEQLKIGAWKRNDRWLVLLVNVGEERLEAEVRFDPVALCFADRQPDQIVLAQRDPNLLTYFQQDITTVEAPAIDDAEPLDLTRNDSALPDLDENPENLPADERRTTDPDGKFEWKNGTLRCPIRRHDFRLFEFTNGTDGPRP